jgi:hypothetical protein
MGPTVDSRMKTSNAKSPLLHIKFESRQANEISKIKHGFLLWWQKPIWLFTPAKYRSFYKGGPT